MVEVKKLVPEVYYNRSRDFQLLGRIIEMVFSYLKTNTNMVVDNPFSYNFDEKLVDLVATTLGFKKAKEYNIKQLVSLCSIFMLAIKNKGNIQSLQDIVNMLANVENCTEECYVSIAEDDPYSVQVFVPLTIKDLTLFNDVLDYILPVGMSCKIIRQTLKTTAVGNNVSNEIDIRYEKVHSYETSQVVKFNKDTYKSIMDVKRASYKNKPYKYTGDITDMVVAPFNEDKLKQYIKNEEAEDEGE